MRKWLLLGLFFLNLGTLSANENYPHWLMRKCSIKPGGTAEYTKLKKDWISAYSKYVQGKNSPPIYAYEDLNQSVFVYLVGLQNFADMDRFIQLKDSFTDTLSGSQLNDRANRHAKINSISYSFEYLIKECSHLPQGSPSGFTGYEYAAFFVYSIFPGTEKAFESHLQSLTTSKEFANLAWQTWKIEIGNNLPKYTICLFGNSLDVIKKQNCKINFLNTSQKNILRQERCGTSRLRKDLSYLKN